MSAGFSSHAWLLSLTCTCFSNFIIQSCSSFHLSSLRATYLNNAGFNLKQCGDIYIVHRISHAKHLCTHSIRFSKLFIHFSPPKSGGRKKKEKEWNRWHQNDWNHLQWLPQLPLSPSHRTPPHLLTTFFFLLFFASSPPIDWIQPSLPLQCHPGSQFVPKRLRLTGSPMERTQSQPRGEREEGGGERREDRKEKKGGGERRG